MQSKAKQGNGRVPARNCWLSVSLSAIKRQVVWGIRGESLRLLFLSSSLFYEWLPLLRGIWDQSWLSLAQERVLFILNLLSLEWLRLIRFHLSQKWNYDMNVLLPLVEVVWCKYFHLQLSANLNLNLKLGSCKVEWLVWPTTTDQRSNQNAKTD